MASETDTSTAGRSDPSTVSAAALRLDPLLRKIREELLQYLEAFALAIHGARREDIKWPLFAPVVPDPGDGGTIALVQQQAGDFVGVDNFGICRFNIPVSEADIETAANYLRRCGLDPDAQRLLEVFKGLKAAFCSVVDFIPLPNGSMANPKFYAQDRALMLSEHLEDLIRTLPMILTGGGAGQSRPASAPEEQPPAAELGGDASTPTKAKRSTERSEGTTDDQPLSRLLSVFTNGLAEVRIQQALTVLHDEKLTTNEKLVKIDGFIRFPATTSAEQLGQLLGVTKQAVLKTEWWIQNRRGEKANEIGRRRNVHKQRAAQLETIQPSDEDD